MPAPSAETPRLRRLTPRQLAQVYQDLIGRPVTLPELEAVPPVHGLRALGAASATLSGAGVEQLDTAARAAADVALNDEATRRRLVPCAAAGGPDEACTRDTLVSFGRRAFRRPLTTAETDRYLKLARDARDASPADPWAGLRAVFAGLLSSPKLVYRAELGQPADGRRRHGGYELASRLSFLIWNTTPDDPLLDAAGAGKLDSEAGLRAEIDRLWRSPRAREGLSAFLVEQLGLDVLDQLERDTAIFPRFTPTLGSAMRRETELVLADIAFERDADLRELLDARFTFVNDELARLYGLPAPPAGTFTRVTLPDGPRVGLLGHAGVLTRTSKPDDTSPTLRGLFVRSALLCQEIPPPPPDVEAMLKDPEPGRVLSKREQILEHATHAACAACHRLMDPIGVALEPFDGLGAHRTTDRGLPIDARGELDGRPFEGPRGLAALLREHPAFDDCLVRTLFRYASGRMERNDETAALEALTTRFRTQGHRLRALVTDLALSDLFRSSEVTR